MGRHVYGGLCEQVDMFVLNGFLAAKVSSNIEEFEKVIRYRHEVNVPLENFDFINMYGKACYTLKILQDLSNIKFENWICFTQQNYRLLNLPRKVEQCKIIRHRFVSKLFCWVELLFSRSVVVRWR